MKGIFKIIFILLFFILIYVNFIYSNTNNPKVNSLYIEILGKSAIGSINYDVRITKELTIGIGTGHSLLILNSFLFLSYLFPGNIDHNLELGIALSILHKENFSEIGRGIVIIPIIGYRFQPLNGGFIFRISYTPWFAFTQSLQINIPLILWGGISFGWCF